MYPHRIIQSQILSSTEHHNMFASSITSMTRCVVRAWKLVALRLLGCQVQVQGSRGMVHRIGRREQHFQHTRHPFRLVVHQITFLLSEGWVPTNSLTPNLTLFLPRPVARGALSASTLHGSRVAKSHLPPKDHKIANNFLHQNIIHVRFHNEQYGPLCGTRMATTPVAVLRV